MVSAVANATVPKYTVLIGGSYGAGNYGMCGRGFNPRLLFAWPNSRIATMSADTAETVLTDIRLGGMKGADDHDAGAGRGAPSAEVRRSIRDPVPTPIYATSRLWDDGLIDPVRHPRCARPVRWRLAAIQDEPAAGFRSSSTGCRRVSMTNQTNEMGDLSAVKLLVANRGEIARRVDPDRQTDLDITTVAVYAEPDAGAPFVVDADDVRIMLGPADIWPSRICRSTAS